MSRALGTSICHTSLVQGQGAFSTTLGPVEAVGGTPDVVVGLVRGQVVAAGEDPELAVEGQGLVVRPGRPGGLGRGELPMGSVSLG